LRYIFPLTDQLVIRPLRKSLWDRFGDRMKRWVLAGALALAAGGQGLASDLPPPAAPPPPRAPAAYIPPPSPVYNWGGLYFGFNAGYGFGTSNWTDPQNFSGQTTTGNFNTTGFVGGATVGVNFQTDAFVYGAELDFDGSLNDGKSSGSFCGSVGFGSGAQCETKNFWFSTLRARLGYAADRVLFYGTAGGALGDVASGINNSIQRSTKGGWTAGAGLEAAFTENLTGRIEYLYMSLQNGSCTNAANCGLDAPGIAANDTVKFSTSMIRVGIDYKFH
jgi:outer membrane immunogenic protein